MYDTASEIEMIFECDHDCGADSNGWPRHIKFAADQRQQLHIARMGERKLVRVIERCDGIGNIFFLSRHLHFESVSPGGGLPKTCCPAQPGGPLVDHISNVAAGANSNGGRV